MKEFSVKLEEHEGVITALLSGTLTGEADFSSVQECICNGKTMIFDLGEVRQINSWGVLKWLELISLLHEHHTVFSFKRCSVPMVHHFSEMSGFSGGGRIESVLVPFYCEDCDHPHDELMEIDLCQHIPELPEIPCPSCGKPMAFDDIPEVYFRFLRISAPTR